MTRAYSYLGSETTRQRAERAGPRGWRVQSASDLRDCVERFREEPGQDRVTVTFVVLPDGDLYLAPRRSEHVDCAGGGEVLAAGELDLAVTGAAVSVRGVTNQSTGYCPEPVSWSAVVGALARAGIAAPRGYARRFVFRRCPACGQKNIVKDNWWFCGVCEVPLPRVWNMEARAEG